MAHNHVKVNFEPLREEGITEEEDAVVMIFESAFKSLSDATVHDEARSVASQLEKLVSSELPEDQFEIIWEAFLGIGTHLHHRNGGQEFVIEVLRILAATDTWKGFPCLERTLRDRWIDPTFETVEGEEETYTLSQWLNLNSFHARLLGSGLVVWDNFAAWQLRHGLEEELIAGEATDCRVSAASEWLIQASPLLLQRCLQEMGELTELHKTSFGPGALFHGAAGLDLQRWDFWKRRLGEVQALVGEETKANVDEAVRCMTEAARALVK